MKFKLMWRYFKFKIALNQYQINEVEEDRIVRTFSASRKHIFYRKEKPVEEKDPVFRACDECDANHDVLESMSVLSSPDNTSDS